MRFGIGTSGAVDADVAGGGDVWAAVRLGHDGDYGDARGGAHRLGAQGGQQRVAMLVRDRADQLHQLRGGSSGVGGGQGSGNGVSMYRVLLFGLVFEVLGFGFLVEF